MALRRTASWAISNYHPAHSDRNDKFQRRTVRSRQVNPKCVIVSVRTEPRAGRASTTRVLKLARNHLLIASFPKSHHMTYTAVRAYVDRVCGCIPRRRSGIICSMLQMCGQKCSNETILAATHSNRVRVLYTSPSGYLLIGNFVLCTPLCSYSSRHQSAAEVERSVTNNERLNSPRARSRHRVKQFS